jgi:putative ABC transport system permease protein
MNFSESFKQAMDSLKANKLRSILTMLGIIMGVFSVITILAVGNATQGYINSQFEKLGANTISVVYKSMSISQSDMLTNEDLNIVKNASQDIKNVGTMFQGNGTLRMGSENKNAMVSGVTSQYNNFDPKEMAIGRYISDIDVSSRARVVIVSDKFAKKYFKKIEIIGEILNFKSQWGSSMNLKVIGVTKTADDLMGSILNMEDYATTIYMPISTLQEIYFNNKNLNEIKVSIVEKNKIKDVSQRIIKALELKHRNKDKYFTYSSEDMQGAFSKITTVVSAVLLVIAIITLVVGGIGIINILLVSVTERIREIGVRKALGAQKKDIVMQFLTESIVMTGISGLIGILLGLAVGAIISSQLKLPPVVDLKIIVLALLGSIGLGLMFGVYPAKRAADLDPIESLRYE